MSKGNIDIETVLAQWQTCVDMANSISQRRDTMNNLFVTLNLAIVTAVSIIWDLRSIFIMIAGIVLCIIWILFIRNFKLLNREKFKVINKMEKALPEQPFNDEWDLLCKNIKYKDGTKLENTLPIMFIILYIASVVAMVIIKITNGGIL